MKNYFTIDKIKSKNTMFLIYLIYRLIWKLFLDYYYYFHTFYRQKRKKIHHIYEGSPELN